MEMKHSKPSKGTSKIFSFLPKTATVTFQNHPFSPGREKHRAENHNKLKAFSGPIISMIPDEARIRKSRNGRSNNFDTQEPTSPKVSCMGQIKQKKKECRSKCGLPKSGDSKDKKNKQTPATTSKDYKPNPKLKTSLSFGNIFRRQQGRKSDAGPTAAPVSDDHNKAPAPGLDQMKRFASGRDTFANFDWKAVSADRRNYHSDHEESDGEEDDDYVYNHDDEVIIPHSAPLVMMGGGGGLGGGGTKALEPRKEINLWKRRTTAPPRPLQINVRTKPQFFSIRGC